jgi:abequosyltransferase
MVNPQKQTLNPAESRMTEEPPRIEDAKPLLTIAIPTYNRARYLRELLSVLFDQLISEPRVELIISDNASPDETPDVIAEFQQRGLRLRNIRNETNIGADCNFLQCFEQARGKYVWIFGDDDILPSGSLTVVLKLLATYEPDFVFVTPREFRDERTPVSYLSDPRGRRPMIIEDKYRFARMVGNMLTMLTCNIVNKMRIESLAHASFRNLLGTGLVHLGWSLPLLANFNNGIYVYDVLVAVRAGNRSGYSISKVFGQNFKSITDVVRYCLTFLIIEVRRRRFGDFKEESFHAELKPLYGGTLQYWLFLFPVISTPVWIATRWFSMIQVFRKAGRALDLIISKMSWRRPAKTCEI